MSKFVVFYVYKITFKQGDFIMSKKNTDAIPDKQTYIKQYMRNQFLLNNVINPDGKILDLAKFQTLIAQEIEKIHHEMRNNSTIDAVVIDRYTYAEQVGELEYLQDLAKHKDYVDELKEHPIKSYEDLPKKPKKIWFPNLRITGIILRERIRQVLQH